MRVTKKPKLFNRFGSNKTSNAEENSSTWLLYDKGQVLWRCEECKKLPNAYGLTILYAMSIDSNISLIKTIADAGLHLEASCLDEVTLANLAGVPYKKVRLTTQKVYDGEEFEQLKSLLLEGLKYNICSIEQLYQIGDFACKNFIDPGIIIRSDTFPGEENPSNIADSNESFGIAFAELDEMLKYAWGRWLKFNHVNFDSGPYFESPPQTVDFELGLIAKFFKETNSVRFSAKLCDKNNSGESSAQIAEFGNYAKKQIKAFNKKHKRKLKLEAEFGKYILANKI